MTSIRPLSPSELDALVQVAEVIEQDARGFKVLRLPDGAYLKYFRRKRFFNRELMVPAAIRFARNARQLWQMGIPTMRVTALHRIVGEPHTVAIYQPLPGRTLRELLASGEADEALMYRIGEFLAQLHRLGILFRSVHPGNIVVNDGEVGLIDVLDIRFHPFSLSRWQRRRNWLHLLRYPDEWRDKSELIRALLQGYRDIADLPGRELSRLLPRVDTILSH
jgi:hypothetical protein